MVFAIMLMGVGYAAWTDKITVKTTVATGEFDVDFTAVSFEALNEVDIFEIASQIDDESDAVLDEESGDNGDIADKIIVNVANLYPGASFKVVADVTNTGTIPALLDKIYVSGAEHDFFDLLQVEVIYSDGPNNVYNYQIYKGAVSGLDKQLFSTTLIDLGITPLEEKDTDKVTFTFEFPYDFPEGYELPEGVSQEGYFENLTKTFNIHFDWIQFNAPFTAE